MAEFNTEYRTASSSSWSQFRSHRFIHYDNAVEISIQQKLDSLLLHSSNPPIRKVPKYMSKAKRECYEPSVVSIGPLFYNILGLRPSLELKLKHLQCFLDFGNYDYGLGQYIEIVREQEDQIRSFYEGKSILSSNEFVEMVLIDAVFIIILFMLPCNLFPDIKQHVANRVEVICKVNQDLFLVQNQLPFFVLCDLFDTAFGAKYPNLDFKDITCLFISCTSFPGREAAYTKACREKISVEPNIEHLVAFLRICCLPTKLRDQLPVISPNDEDDTQYSKTVKHLKVAGVKFIASETSSLLDVTFSKGVLQIPTLNIQGSTEAILRNMSFFEQCHHSFDSYIIDYLRFMDALIDTQEDVQILVQNGIIKHLLGSDKEVAILVNRITKDVNFNNQGFYYAQLCEDLNAYASTKWNRWTAVLRRDYFKHPWSIISLIYLVVLLILTGLQVYTGFKA